MRDQDKMDRLSERAEWLAGASWWRQRQGGTLTVLPRWTAWLLMRRAGVPVELIADVYKLDARHVRRRLHAATALMTWPPYAARIEAMMRQMQPFGTSAAKEGPCAVPAV